MTPKNLKVRPTTDFAKEALLNIIENNFDIEDCDILDLFSGTGNISFEFASRGAKSIKSVEQNTACYKFIVKTKQELGFDNMNTIRADVMRFVPKLKGKYDLVFADPFYDMTGVEEIPKMIFQQEILKKDGWLILEHSKNHDFSEHAKFHSTRTYGNVNFTIFINS